MIYHKRKINLFNKIDNIKGVISRFGVTPFPIEVSSLVTFDSDNNKGLQMKASIIYTGVSEEDAITLFKREMELNNMDAEVFKTQKIILGQVKLEKLEK